ncbi:MAG TPA: DMT family transporter [Candidatus Thermoplasmatota archaeon]|nr:DMT family transporter [Candidatus Thermoplasmatota archaeon]
MLGPAAGLGSAAAWGAGDFAGGLAARRTPVLVVVLLSQLLGLVAIVALALVIREPMPEVSNWLWGGAAGLSGIVGICALYGSLAAGRMGIAAPVSGVIAAALPIAYAWGRLGTPAPLGLGGMALALFGIILVSAPKAERPPARVLGLAMLSGVGFAGFFILMDESSDEAFLWTIAAARISGALALLILVLMMRPGWGQPGLTVVLASMGDTVGNAFFLVAVRLARLDVAVVLSSLYPAITVLLARIVLKEKLTPMQAWGAGVMLVAIPLIAWGA